MTNEEFKSKNDEFVGQLVKAEIGLISNIKEILNDISVPSPCISFKSKLDELFKVFENDGKTLDQHLTVVLYSQYLMQYYYSIIQDMDLYFRNLIDSIGKKNKSLYNALINMRHDVSKSWIEKDTQLLDIDFEKDLQKALDSGIMLPPGITKEVAYQICMKELKAVNYKPANSSIRPLP
jgi:hypothetical protein